MTESTKEKTSAANDKLGARAQETSDALTAACHRLVMARMGNVSGAVAKEAICAVLEASLNFVEACTAIHDAGGAVAIVTQVDLDNAKRKESEAVKAATKTTGLVN